MHLDQILITGVSIASLIISIYSFSQSHKVAKRQNYINEKGAYAEQFKSYTSLLYNEYGSLNQKLQAISNLLCNTTIVIGEILDLFDNRGKNSPSTHTWFLRHLYCNLYRISVEVLGDELTWQSSENLYHQLTMFKTLDIKLDFKENMIPKKKFLKLKEKPKKELNLYTLLQSELFREQFSELTFAVNESDYLELYNQIINQCQPLVDYLEDIKPILECSLDKLEINYHKNKLEVFKLQEYPALHHRFRQFMKLLTFINQSRLASLTNVKHKAPYNTVSQILYIGILIVSSRYRWARTVYRH